MRKIFTLILITIAVSGYAQDKDKNHKREHRKMRRELKDMRNLQADGDMVTVAPAVVDAFIESIKQSDMDKIREMVDEDLLGIQTKEDLIKTIGLYGSCFGKLKEYEQTSFEMSTKSEFGQLAIAEYNVRFEKYKGKANGVYKVYDKNTVKMFSFNISLEDYTTVDTLDKIAKPAVNAIKAKDKQQIYSLTSDRFKEHTPILEFESGVGKILELDISEMRMFKNIIAVKEGNEVVVIIYEINDKEGYIQLTYTNIADKFELEWLNYTPYE